LLSVREYSSTSGSPEVDLTMLGNLNSKPT
jgi:hypothetical protein